MGVRIGPAVGMWLSRALLLCWLLVPLYTVGQGATTTDAESPNANRVFLSPADTSSPRDTLRTSLEAATAVYQAGIDGRMDEILQPRSRAAQTLHFSETVNGFSWDEQGLRMLYLKEVLDRVELPPWEAIPGDEQVKSGEIDDWRVPGTRIVIARVSGGDRDGEFLFSAGTVADLHAIYRQLQELPYQPGAKDSGTGSQPDYRA